MIITFRFFFLHRSVAWFIVQMSHLKNNDLQFTGPFHRSHIALQQLFKVKRFRI